MNDPFPKYLRGSLARISLSAAQLVLLLGTVIGPFLVFVVCTHLDEDLAIVALLVAPAVSVLCCAFYIVIATTKGILFPEHSHDESTNASTRIIPCENGHDVHVSKGQAGAFAACPTCGSDTKVPALSEFH